MKLAFLSMILMVVCVFPFHAQNQFSIQNKKTIRQYREAREWFAEGEFNQARILLEKALEREPSFKEAMLLLGDLYHAQEEYEKEMAVLKNALLVDSAFFISTYYNIGEAAFLSGNFEEAIAFLKNYSSKISNSAAIDRAHKLIKKAEFAREAMANPQDIVLRNEGGGINSAYDEYWPSLTADEQTLVVTVLVPRNDSLFKEKGHRLVHSPMNYREDFYVSMAGDSLWQLRQPVPGEINTQNNEGAQTLSADGNWMFFTACGRSDSRGSCDIYFSKRLKHGWSTPVNIGSPVNTPFWESQPCFSSDGQSLYFVSNRSNGVGGKDIWKVTLEGLKEDGTPYFGALTNLGEVVNTSGDENSPFLHHDGQTLYFSSDGHVGMGKMDLFVSRKSSGGQWQPPLNMGHPINTGKDEIGLVVNAKGNRAFFSSDRQNSKARGKDIYSFVLPESLRPSPVIYVKGRVVDALTGKPLPAMFDLTDLKTGQLRVVARGNESSGEFLVSLPLGGHFAFKAEHPGYLFYSGNFNLSDTHNTGEPYRLDIALQPIRRGAQVILENIFFNTGSSYLESESEVELKELVGFLGNHPDVRIMLEGHTDNVGSEAYNLELSTNRAKAVYTYLVKHGVGVDRLEYKGFGYSRPVEKNDTSEGRARNRRTEIQIL